jgi:hypothetical protein
VNQAKWKGPEYQSQPGGNLLRDPDAAWQPGHLIALCAEQTSMLVVPCPVFRHALHADGL